MMRCGSGMMVMLALMLGVGSARAQSAVGPVPVAAAPGPMGVPKPGPATEAAYVPQPILQGGGVPLYPAGSPFLDPKRVWEAEVYNLSEAAPGRINSIVHIHNPSIEVHTVERGINTGRW